MSDISKVQQPLWAWYVCTARLYKGYTLYLQSRNLLRAAHTHAQGIYYNSALESDLLFNMHIQYKITYYRQLRISVCDPDAVSTFFLCL